MSEVGCEERHGMERKNLVRSLRSISDPTRMRLLMILREEALSVAEIQEVTKLAQSRISTHLGNMTEAGLVRCERKGKRSFYEVVEPSGGILGRILDEARDGLDEVPEAADDQVNLRRILDRRKDEAQAMFHKAAGCFDRLYGPGRSWEAFGKALLKMLPAIDVADLGSGEGLLSELLAHRCRHVYAIDNSEKIVRYGLEKARGKGIGNLTFLLGDIEAVPLGDRSVDVVLMSQSLHHARDPEKAISESWRILRGGGRLLILDLLQHDFQEAGPMYGDQWLGFAEADLHRWLESCQFSEIDINVVAIEKDPPNFSTILVEGMKRIPGD